MQIFCAVIPKNIERQQPLSPADLEYDVKAVMARLAPALASEIPTVSSHSVGQSRLFYLSNETEGKVSTNEVAVSILLGNSDSSPDSFFSTEGLVLLEQISQSSGNFGVVRLHQGGFDYLTDIVGSHLCYFAETQSYFVASNRMPIVASVARVVEGRRWDRSPDYFIPSIRGFASSGHFNFSSSAFSGVRCAEAGSILQWQHGSLREYGWRNQVFEEDLTGGDYVELVNRMANALSLACAPMANQSSVKLGLTGGRDSRLVAAALSNFDLSVTASTFGESDSADVILAKELCDFFNWQHNHVLPVTSADNDEILMVERIQRRISRVLDVGGIETSAWDDIEAYGRFDEQLHLSGVGGELLRGGYLATKKSKPLFADVKSLLSNVLGRSPFVLGCISPEENGEANRYLSLGLYSPSEVFDQLYFLNRNSRWVNGRRRQQRFRRNTFDPLMDNKLVSLARSVPLDDRWNEKLVFDVIETLAPGINKIPIEGNAWRFADPDFQGKRVDVKDVDVKSLSSGMSARPKRPDFRALRNMDFRKHFLKTFDTFESDLSAQVIDFSQVRRVLESAEPIKYPTTLWHAITAAGLLAGAWINPVRENSITRDFRL